jgi:single-strand selective monofunctional uracil DNA glycosylase
MVRITRRLARELAALEWSTPSHVYNPLQYAWSGHSAYLERFGARRGRVLLLGMNPGPWGMAQTGVPFGSVEAVRDWFKIDVRLARKLPPQHPKYPILGMACHRFEGSGKRVWGWARDRFGTPERFFRHFFIWNYCPLLFLGHDRNLVPSALRKHEVTALDEVCDRALDRVIKALDPVAIVGIGRYAVEHAAARVGERVPVVYLLHPSPANPLANRSWPEIADQTLAPWLKRTSHPRHGAAKA